MTNLYQMFYYVAKTGSISKAAKALYVTQPAVSKGIKNLEEDLEVPLFVRSSKGVELTVEGKVLFEHVSLGFSQFEEGEKLVKQLKEGNFGRVRIGVSNTLCKYYFLPILNKFHQRYPELKIEIVNRTSGETMKLLDEGKLDCAIISHGRNYKGYNYIALKEINDIFVSKDQPVSKVIPLNSLESFPMLLLEKDNSTRDYIDSFLKVKEVSLNVDIEISSMEFLVEFAKIGLGIAPVIKEFVLEELAKGSLYEWETKPKIPSRTIGLLSKKEGHISIASQRFIEFIEEEER